MPLDSTIADLRKRITPLIPEVEDPPISTTSRAFVDESGNLVAYAKSGRLYDRSGNEVGSGSGSISLQYADGSTLNFLAAADTEAAREASLREAIAAATSDAVIYFYNCRASVTSTALSASLGSGVEDVTFAFDDDSALLYDDYELAYDDRVFFPGLVRDVRNFGYISGPTQGSGASGAVNLAAFNAAYHSLPAFDGLSTDDLGRLIRIGTILFPSGYANFSDTIWISAFVTLQGAGLSATTIWAPAGTAPGTTVNITSNSVANPTVVTTAAPHGLSDQDSVLIEGVVGSIPTINGRHVITRLSDTTFSIPVNVTTGGTGGTMLEEMWQIATSRTSGSVNLTQQVKIFDMTVFGHQTNNFGLSNIKLLGAEGSEIDRVYAGYCGQRSVWTCAGTIGQCIVDAVTMGPGFYGDGNVTGMVANLLDIKHVNRTKTYPLKCYISTSSVANPSVITFREPHHFVTGMSITIAGHTGSTPDINGTHTVTVIGAYSFSIPVNVTVAGTGGTATTGASIPAVLFDSGSNVQIGMIHGEFSPNQLILANCSQFNINTVYSEADAGSAGEALVQMLGNNAQLSVANLHCNTSNFFTNLLVDKSNGSGVMINRTIPTSLKTFARYSQGGLEDAIMRPGGNCFSIRPPNSTQYQGVGIDIGYHAPGSQPNAGVPYITNSYGTGAYDGIAMDAGVNNSRVEVGCGKTGTWLMLGMNTGAQMSFGPDASYSHVFKTIKRGTATLVAGTVTVSSLTAITSSALVIATRKTAGGTTTTTAQYVATAGSESITITAKEADGSTTNTADTSVISWIAFEP